MTPSQSHLVIIPSYNTGGKLIETVTEACVCWQPVWVVLDGSTDGSAAALAEVGGREEGLRILALEHNSGKGAAVMHALLAAAREGFTHALVLDADGQHSAVDIPRFMSVSQKTPAAMILGVPQFAADAPASADAAEPASVADLQRQLADTQDKLATALHSYTVLEDENTRLKDESEAEALRTQVRQLRDQVAELSAENAKLKTRLALLGPLPGGAGVPGRPNPTPSNAP